MVASSNLYHAWLWHGALTQVKQAELWGKINFGTVLVFSVSVSKKPPWMCYAPSVNPKDKILP